MVRTRSSKRKACKNTRRGRMVGVAPMTNHSEGKSKACRVKDMNPVSVPQSRISERLRLKKKRKENQTLENLKANEQLDPDNCESVTLEIGNPEYQAFFLSQLGLVPTSSYLKDGGVMCVDSLPDVSMVSSDSCNSSDDSQWTFGGGNSEAEDSYVFYDSDGEWELDLIICPCDIPEFYEEICRKQSKLYGRSRKSQTRDVGRGPLVSAQIIKKAREDRKIPEKPKLSVKPQSPVPVVRKPKPRPDSPLKLGFNTKSASPRSVPKSSPLVHKPIRPISSMGTIEDIRLHLLNFQTDLEFVE